MKNLQLSIQFIVILLSIFVLTSCEGFDMIGIKGSGPIVTRTLETSDVEGISLEIPANVYLTQGEVQSIRVDAQEIIQNNIKYSTSDGVLHIEFDKPVFKSDPIDIYMTIQSLKEVGINGSGSIVCQNMFQSDKDLHIEINGSGYIDLSANALKVTMLISGSGDINLYTECIQIFGEINGSGNFNLKGGQAEESNYSVSGSGNINAYPLITKSCLVETNGSGDTKINVSKNLSIDINGSGNVYYKGRPSVSANINGSGEIIAVN